MISTSTKKYTVQRNKNGHICKVLTYVASDLLSDCYDVIRRPYTNKSDELLKKTIVNVVLPCGNHHNNVPIHYSFTGEEHTIDVKPHGNSKINIPRVLSKHFSTAD